MEAKILKTIDFELKYTSPLLFLERYYRLLFEEPDKKIMILSEELCLRAYSKAIFLDFKPSIIAGASLIVAWNLKLNSKREKKLLNVEIWDDVRDIETLTGYSAKDFEEPAKLITALFTSLSI